MDGWLYSEGTATLPKELTGNCLESEKGGAKPMITIEALLAVLSFGLTCFSVGYAIVRKDSLKTQK